jgi:hypothetical protein
MEFNPIEVDGIAFLGEVNGFDPKNDHECKTFWEYISIHFEMGACLPLLREDNKIFDMDISGIDSLEYFYRYKI